MREVGITYTVGGGAGQVAQELIIGNWPGGWPATRQIVQQESLGW